ncbi:alanine/glycine:cation symporter family protein [Vermiculatibacterium agrestimuris]|uniref:alanine/glycine:cation symporter family protein n=1 Tax=Vermiculatibacterium agrestimuris TaxID=2941519 RepID=UPI00203AB3E5|nr:amino acid carrier protein [Vermiculatibacterium agrestimuris]
MDILKSVLQGVYGFVNAVVDWVWGLPILIVLVGGGIILTFVIGGVQFRHFGFIMKSTVGSLFDKEEQARKKAAGISPFQAVTAALGSTIGTGNIAGVGSAIAVGGPGALFWMWICGIVAMAIKFAEVTMSVRYRQKNPHGEGYLAGPFMYMRDGLKCKPLAYAFTTLSLLTLSTIGGVHSGAISDNLFAVGIPRIATCLVVTAIVIFVMLGGMKRLTKITDKMVPAMSVVYVICAVIIVGANIGNFGGALKEIFVGAFTGRAAIGGFAGAAVAATIRQGLARGVFSNDAGLGLQATIHAQAAAIDHPAQQGMWAVFETFFDTIVICSLTGFMIIFSGVWQLGETGATLSSLAFGSVLGTAGRYLCLFCLVLFAISSIISNAQGLRIQATAATNSKVFVNILLVFFILMVVAGCMSSMTDIFVLTDFGNGLVIFLNVPSLILLGGELRKLTKEWFDHKGDLDAIAMERK